MRARRVVASAAAVAVLAGLGYGVGTWLRYGRAKRDEGDAVLLDRFMPDYEIRERHEVRVMAPAAITFAAARALELNRSPLVRAIFRGRELLMRSPRRTEKAPPRPFLDEVLSLGWRILAEEPGRELVLGAVTQPWRADVVFRGVAPEEFANFAEPDYAKIVWTLSVSPFGSEASLFRTETRVATTDASARARFRRYWAVLSPGILLIRRETLRMVKREAERRARAA